MQHLERDIFHIKSDRDFEVLALEIFNYQSRENAVYAKYLELIKRNPADISSLSEIPFLPIEFFKSHRVISGSTQVRQVFESSGTTGQQSSKHYLLSEELYQSSFKKHFTTCYGDPGELCILALLPSYLERGSSSLVYMMDHLIKASKHPDSGFYLNEYEALAQILKKRNDDGHPTLLIGVSFALLDLAEANQLQLGDHIIVMETGGMKGRRKELTREELHSILSGAFGIKAIHSEYGMTELLSQAYADESAYFRPPPWMKVFTRDSYDPLSLLARGENGALNIMDLANIYSCSFLATGDIGRVGEDGCFEVKGRLSNTEIRGCNLMVL